MPPARVRGARAALASAVVAACGAPAYPPPAAPAPPPATRTAEPPPRRDETSDLALLAGRWLGKDHESWRYDLDVQIDGTFTQTVEQSSGTLCVLEGQVEVREAQVVRTFSSNDCNAAYVGETVFDEVVILDSDHVVVRTDSGYEIEYQRAR